jgi:hypothetical protein
MAWAAEIVVKVVGEKRRRNPGGGTEMPVKVRCENREHRIARLCGNGGKIVIKNDE